MNSIAGSKVCVVGGAGFLGSHLVNKLVELGCEVSVADDLSVGRKDFVNPKARFIFKDITDPNPEHLRRAFYGIDYVFNYASIPYIPDCFERPVDVVNVNTVGALRVIEAAHKAGVKRILQVSSAEVYGNSATEEELIESQCSIDPVSTYAISKAAIDRLCQCRHDEAGVPVIVLRQFNCVGERETHRYVIPEIISQVHRAPTFDKGWMEIKLGADTKRDFLYAGDAVTMAIDLLENGELGEVYNLGSENNISIYDLARLITSIMRPQSKLRIDQEKSRLRPNDIWELKSNNEKIYKDISSRPTVDLRKALEKTIFYYQTCNHNWGWE